MIYSLCEREFLFELEIVEFLFLVTMARVTSADKRSLAENSSGALACLHLVSASEGFRETFQSHFRCHRGPRVGGGREAGCAVIDKYGLYTGEDVHICILADVPFVSWQP